MKYEFLLQHFLPRLEFLPTHPQDASTLKSANALVLQSLGQRMEIGKSIAHYAVLSTPRISCSCICICIITHL